MFNETSMAGAQIEPSHKYVELEVGEEPSVKQTEIPNSQNCEPDQNREPDETSEEESAVVNKPPAPTPTSVTCLRRSTRVRQKSERYSDQLTLVSTEQQDPCSAAEAKSTSSSARWVEAMEKEIE